MTLSEFEIKRIEKKSGAFIEKKRQPPHTPNELDLGFRIKDQSVEIFEIKLVWNNPEEKMELPVAKATYVKTRNIWKVYWQRADLKWHSYQPKPEVKLIEDFLALIDEDKHACFWG